MRMRMDEDGCGAHLAPQVEQEYWEGKPQTAQRRRGGSLESGRAAAR